MTTGPTAPPASGGTTSDPAAALVPGLGRSLPLVLPLVLAPGVVLALIGLVLTGAAAPLVLADPGPLVRWGLPVLRVLMWSAAAATVGLLGLAAFLVPERKKTERRVAATRLASRTALLWAVSGLALLLFTFSALAGTPLTSQDLLSQLLQFVWSLEITRVILISSALALAVSVGAAFATRRAPMAWMCFASVAAVVVFALSGHSAGSASHETAVNALGVHLAGVVVWVGGLLALTVVRPALGRDLGATVARYSTLALWGFAAVALSGIQQAIIRLGGPSGFATPYGWLVLAKAVLLLGLGWFGWNQRRALITRLTRDPADGRAFARLATGELLLMGAATGLAAALSRSAPPVPDALPAPGRVLDLTGFADPGPLTSAAWFTAWRVNWLFLAIAVLALSLYAAGVVRLRRRGDAWPAGRTVCWVIGWLIWIYATCGAPEIWGRVLFSVHMLMHMAVAMIVPLFLVPAAPITLLLRALPARTDKTWGVRELTLQAVHSRALVVLANPVVAASFFFASLAAFYWSPLFGIALTTHTGHLAMMAHFLLTGFLFTWVLIGIDPGPPRWSPLMLLVILFVTISFHAFFGVALTETSAVMAPEFFNALNLPWGPDPLADQHTAGEIAWGIGEVPTLILAVLVARQWVRRDKAETIRLDRKADRDGDAELAAYNEFLAGLRRETEGRP